MQHENAFLHIFWTFFGIIIFVSEYLVKHIQGMLLILLEIYTFESEEHNKNALSPIFVTLSGIVILWSDEQYEKANLWIFTTVFGIIMFLSDKQF